MRLRTDRDRNFGRPATRSKAAGFLIVLGAVAWAGVAGRDVAASSGDGTVDPNGRGIQLLGAREAILLEQSARAQQGARARALALYRLLRFAAVERGAEALETGAGAGATRAQGRQGGRAVALGTAVLDRDLSEARQLRAELDRVRAERGNLRTGAGSEDRPGAGSEDRPGAGSEGGPGEGEAIPRLPRSSPPSSWFLRPVFGAVVIPFGVARDPATGAWIFRAAASFAARATEPVRSPGSGRIIRVADSIAGGVAVVLAHDKDRWTSVVSGLGAVRVTPGDLVRRGDVLGIAASDSSGRSGSPVRIETWCRRSPVDPASVLRER